jgi:hypothetical protein
LVTGAFSPAFFSPAFFHEVFSQTLAQLLDYSRTAFAIWDI